MTGWPFGATAPLSYDLLLADPPWAFTLYSDRGAKKSPQAHYACMALEDIKRLPVGALARGDCLLFLWATFPMLPQAFEVIAAWGFRYVTGGAWHKKTVTGKSVFGTGYRLRSACEPFLIALNGNPPTTNAVRNVLETLDAEGNGLDATIREHSRKPAGQYEFLEALCPDALKRGELFARQKHPGWDAWGNETGKFGEDTHARS